MILFPLVVVVHLRSDFDIAESVLQVEIGNGVLIPAHIALAVASAPDLERNGHQEHPLPNRLSVEIVVSLNHHLHQLVAFAGINDVIDLLLVVHHFLSLIFHLCVEIALGLKVVPQISLAFHEQVGVHRVFFEDGNISL